MHGECTKTQLKRSVRKKMEHVLSSPLVRVRCPTCSSVLETACSGGDRIINVRCGSCSTVFSAELPRPVQTPRLPTPPVGACDWQCTTCTLVNKAERTNCSACGSSQPWTCRFCGRSNNPSHAAACAGCKREGAGRAAYIHMDEY